MCARLRAFLWDRYGRGSGSQARLNHGDCFSYEAVHVAGEPLFKGNDFNTPISARCSDGIRHELRCQSAGLTSIHVGVCRVTDETPRAVRALQTGDPDGA